MTTCHTTRDYQMSLVLYSRIVMFAMFVYINVL